MGVSGASSMAAPEEADPSMVPEQGVMEVREQPEAVSPKPPARYTEILQLPPVHRGEPVQPEQPSTPARRPEDKGEEGSALREGATPGTRKSKAEKKKEKRAARKEEKSARKEAKKQRTKEATSARAAEENKEDKEEPKEPAEEPREKGPEEEVEESTRSTKRKLDLCMENAGCIENVLLLEQEYKQLTRDPAHRPNFLKLIDKILDNTAKYAVRMPEYYIPPPGEADLNKEQDEENRKLEVYQEAEEEQLSEERKKRLEELEAQQKGS